MIKRGTFNLSYGDEYMMHTATVDVVEKTNNSYTEYLVRRTNTHVVEYNNGEVMAEYDWGAEDLPTLYNHLTLDAIMDRMAESGNIESITWTTPLAEV